MTEEIKKTVVQLEANLSKLDRQLKKGDTIVSTHTRRMSKTLDRFDQKSMQIGKSLQGVFGVAGVGAAVAVAGNSFRKTAQDMDKLYYTAGKLGVTTSELQELRFMAAEVSVETRTMDMGMQRFTRRVAEAQQGTGELLPVLRQYNIAVRNADGTSRKMTEVLEDLADAAQSAESHQEALRISFKAFDSEGAQLVNMLVKGSAAMQEWSNKAADLGVIVDEKTVAELAATNAQLGIMELQLDALKAKTAGPLAAAFNDWMDVTHDLSSVEDRLEEITKHRATIQRMLLAYPEDVRKRQTKLLRDLQSLSKEEMKLRKQLAAMKDKPKDEDTDKNTGPTPAQVAAEKALRALEIRTLRASGHMAEAMTMAAEEAKQAWVEKWQTTMSADQIAAGLEKFDQELAANLAKLGDNGKRETALAALASAEIAAMEALGKSAEAIRAKTALEKEAIKKEFKDIYSAEEMAQHLAAIDAVMNEKLTKIDADKAKPVDDLLSSMLAEAEALENNVAMFDASAAALARFNAQQQVAQALKEAEVTLSAEENALLTDYINRIGEATAKHDALQKSKQEAAEASAELARRERDWQNALNQSFLTMISNANSLGDVLESLARKMLNSALFGADGAGGLLGGFTSKAGGFMSNLFGGAFADGGTPPLGKVSLVGERGPELFVPKSVGTIIPAQQTAAMLAPSGGGVTVNQTIMTPDANSFRASARQVQRDTMHGMGRIASR